MAIGRKTGGRQRGTPNRASAAREAALAASGLTPLEFMMQLMRDSSVPLTMRAEMARAAAPYCHPRLAASTVTVTEPGSATQHDEPDLSGLTIEELEQLHSWLSRGKSPARTGGGLQ